jgi:hypothetical protein
MFLLSKSSGLQKSTPPPAHSLHTELCSVQGVGERWIFSSTNRSFGYGYEAVWIRVKEERYKGKSKIPLQEFF